MSNPYPCRGDIQETQFTAALALEARRHVGLRNYLEEVEQPYVYMCREGHWHFSLRQRAHAAVYADHPDYDEAWRA